MPLFLIGYMASGKTTFGHALAEKTGKKFIDLDEYIEESYGCSISDIFHKKGEEEFRKIENRSLLEVAAIEDAIIACGGGTPCFFNNMEIMNSSGKTIFLKASLGVLASRLEESNSKRPLVAGKSIEEIKSTIRNHIEQRLPYYSKAHITWDSDNLDTEEEIETNIANFIRKYPFVFSTPFI